MRFVLIAFLVLGFSPANAQLTVQTVFQKCDVMVEAALVAEVAGADGDADARAALQIARQQTAFECSDFLTYSCNLQTVPENCLKIVGDLYLDDAMESRGALKDLHDANRFIASRIQKWAARSREDVIAGVISDCIDEEAASRWSPVSAHYPNFTLDSICRFQMLFSDHYQTLGWRKRGYQQGILVASE